jgi:hypothetical protein
MKTGFVSGTGCRRLHSGAVAALGARPFEPPAGAFCLLLISLLLVGGTASAATQMYVLGALSVKSFGNLTSDGTTYPYTSRVYLGIPRGPVECGTSSNWCSAGNPAVQRGHPLRGSAVFSVTPTLGSVPFDLPQGMLKRKLGVPATTFTYGPGGTKRPANGSPGYSYGYSSYFFSLSYADLENQAGGFFGGNGGPPGGFGITHTEGGYPAGSVNVTASGQRFGGTMNLLGYYLTTHYYNRSVGWSLALFSTWELPAVGGGKATTAAAGGLQVGGTNFRFNTGVQGTYTEFVVATVFPWTTGTATVTATRGQFFTVTRQSGYDSRNEEGAGNIQLVTPMLTHWTCPACGSDYETGAIGVMKLRFIPVPEPGNLLALVAGISLLGLLYRRRVGTEHRD